MNCVEKISDRSEKIGTMKFVLPVLLLLSIFGNQVLANSADAVPAGTDSPIELGRQRHLDLKNSGTSHSSKSRHHNDSNGTHDSDGHSGIHVASWRYDFVKHPFIVTFFIICVVVVKVLFHHVRKIAEVIPESCMLITLGIALGIVFLADESALKFLDFNPKIFFLYLLPPIILEAAYSLKDRAFLENIGTILLYAVVGTILNVILIAFGLFALERIGALAGFNIGLLDCLVFGSLIAAVDPVAVLAIFEELGVNKMLYYMVFGESLFNDAVTVVLYNLMVAFREMDVITASDVGKGFASFLCSSFGATIIGLLFGLLSAFITKYSSKVRVTEPIVMFGMAYLSYLVAELFHLSGIISIICCGLNQAQYAAENISSKSYITVYYFSKVASSVTESLIFIILGVTLVQMRGMWVGWHTGFALYSLLLCLLVRFLVVFFLTSIVNYVLLGIRKISIHEQCIMGYGGLRGAVCFSLVFMLDKSTVKDPLMTTTLLIILFTVFVQGITLKPLVHFLRIKLQSTDKKLIDEVNRGTVSKYLSRKFLRPAIQKNVQERGQGLLTAFQEIQLQSQMKRTATSSAQLAPSQSIAMELSLLDDSTANSYSTTMLNAYDDQRSALNKKERTVVPIPSHVVDSVVSTVEVSSPVDILRLRDMLNKPLHKIIHYKMGDRNLQENKSESRTARLEHLLRLRRHVKSNKKKGITKAILPSLSSSYVVLAPVFEEGELVGAEGANQNRNTRRRTSDKDADIELKPHPQPRFFVSQDSRKESTSESEEPFLQRNSKSH